jgi:tetratricopeptide (TPR) repeat protein
MEENMTKWNHQASSRMLRPVLVFLLGSVAVSLGAVWYMAGEDVDALYDEGMAAMSESRFHESIRLLERVTLERPGDIELLYWLGHAYWNREEANGAIWAYGRAVELDPEDSSEWSLYALENLAEVYTRTDRPNDARRAYVQALEREDRPEWIERIHNQIAEIDLVLGTLPVTGGVVVNEKGEIVGGVGPGRMRTNRNFEIARQTLDPVKQERYYRLAVDTDPGMYQPYFNLGLALVHQGRFAEAIPWLERSDRVWKEDTDVNPRGIDKSDAHAFLALSRLEQGDTQAARHHAQRALEADPAYFWAVLYAQRVNTATGRVMEAIPVLDSLMTDNPEHVETLLAMAEAFETLGRAGKAAETRDRAISLIPGSHPWMGRLARKGPPPEEDDDSSRGGAMAWSR